VEQKLSNAPQALLFRTPTSLVLKLLFMALITLLLLWGVMRVFHLTLHYSTGNFFLPMPPQLQQNSLSHVIWH